MKILFGNSEDANGVEIKTDDDGDVIIWPVIAGTRVASGGPVEIPWHPDNLEFVAIQLMNLAGQIRQDKNDVEVSTTSQLDEDCKISIPA